MTRESRYRGSGGRLQLKALLQGISHNTHISREGQAVYMAIPCCLGLKLQSLRGICCIAPLMRPSLFQLKIVIMASCSAPDVMTIEAIAVLEDMEVYRDVCRHI